jgi:hypothetical protein
MFSPNQLYDYLRYHCYVNKKRVVVRNFIHNGSKNLRDLTPLETPYNNVAITDPDALRETFGCMDMYDQEPVDISILYTTSLKDHLVHSPNSFRSTLNPVDFVCFRSMGIYTPIICHSEQNSDDINNFKENLFTPVHFWSNAITSRFWFAHYELLQKELTSSKHRFGTYIRDTSGTRKYRKKVLEILSDTDTFCPILLHNNTDIPSDASASLPWVDHTKFDIQIVPETIFDTEKTHLTEKIFKPIVMYQSFILYAPPNSLVYMKKYGFKTFNECWDERYDLEMDSTKRFNMVTDVINELNSLCDKDYRRVIAKTSKIIDYNRKHFFSDVFKKQLLNELHVNLENAFNIQEENFQTIPGGTLFHYHDMYYKESGQLLKNSTPSLHKALRYVEQVAPMVAKSIIKQYNHLLG